MGGRFAVGSALSAVLFSGWRFWALVFRMQSYDELYKMQNKLHKNSPYIIGTSSFFVSLQANVT